MDGTGPLAQAKAFSGFSTDEAANVRSFYEDTLGLRVSGADGMLTLHLGGGTDVLVYPKGPEVGRTSCSGVRHHSEYSLCTAVTG